jgi:AraC-like DNA-binding protein
MEEVSPPVTTLRFSDPERAAAAVRGAGAMSCQLSRHAAISEIARVVFPDACLDMVRLGPAMLLSGVMPRDCFSITFLLMCPQPARSLNFHTTCTNGDLEFFPPGSPLDVTTPAGYRHATLTLVAAKFHAQFAIHCPDAADRLLAKGAAMHVSPMAQRQMRAVLRAMWRMMWDPEQPLTSLLARRAAEHAVSATFFAALLSGSGNLVPPATQRVAGRHRRLRQARDYLAAHLDQPIYLEDLCTTLGLSRRAAENLFRDFLGLSPVVYLQRQRLHGARRALQRAAAIPGTIKQVAIDYGFRHFGNFAHDYRALFGESPSETLTPSTRR